jgi:hypothetical protein
MKMGDDVTVVREGEPHHLMRAVHRISVIVIVGLGACFCLALFQSYWLSSQGITPVIYYNADDENLGKKVEKAARDQVRIEDAEAVVGRAASLDTRNADDRNRWQTLWIEDDPSAGGTLPDLREATDAMYWIRPVGFDYRKIVGLVWHPNGQIQAFYGTIHPGRRGRPIR